MSRADWLAGAIFGAGVVWLALWARDRLMVRLPTRGEIENPREVTLDIEDDRVTKVEYKA